jgi:hypothetical protein
MFDFVINLQTELFYNPIQYIWLLIVYNEELSRHMLYLNLKDSSYFYDWGT